MKRTQRQTVILALVGLLWTPVAVAQSTPDDAVCLDQDIKADLDRKRKSRSVKERLVQKTNRHELGVRGGHYVSDAFDASWTAGGAYTYYLTEDFAVEASGLYTRTQSRGGEELERTFELLKGKSRGAWLFASNLVYVPLHGKLQSGSSILHMDVSLTVGAGVVDSALSSGVAGNGGLGFSFFLGKAVVLRIDVRDYVFRQQLLSEKIWVNDLVVTGGLGILLPFTE